MDDPQKSEPSPFEDFDLWLSHRLGDVDQILRTMDLSSPKIRWKIHQWQKDLANRRRIREEAANRGPAPQLCPHCGLVAGVGKSHCPYCGKKLTGAAATFAGFRQSLSQNDAGENSSVSQTLLFIMIGVFVLGLALGLKQGGGGQGFNLGSWSMLHNAWYYKFSRVLGGEFWRLVTALFLHGGFMHIIFNVMALVQIGPQIEGQFGSARFTALFLLSGFAGHVGSTISHGGGGGSLGASGAIFGLIGALYVSARFFGGPGASIARDIAKRWIFYGLIFGFVVPGIDNGAHFGGLIGGGLLVFLLGGPAAETGRLAFGRSLGYASGLVIAGGLVWGLAEAFILG